MFYQKLAISLVSPWEFFYHMKCCDEQLTQEYGVVSMLWLAIFIWNVSNKIGICWFEPNDHPWFLEHEHTQADCWRDCYSFHTHGRLQHRNKLHFLIAKFCYFSYLKLLVPNHLYTSIVFCDLLKKKDILLNIVLKLLKYIFWKPNV